MSRARRHREALSAARSVALAAAPSAGAAPAVAAAGAPSPEEAGIALRLTHDLRRLHEIRSVDLKIAAKREMLPEYAAWVEGVLDADNGVGDGPAAEVLPTMMVWAIDTGAYARALEILAFLLRHDVAMPARYQRDAATVGVEEIAEAALRAQLQGAPFPAQVLDEVHVLTIARDLHDEVRAKLWKAIGIAELEEAEPLPLEEALPHLRRAEASLVEAQRLNPRSGVKTKLARAQKLMAE